MSPRGALAIAAALSGCGEAPCAAEDGPAVTWAATGAGGEAAVAIAAGWARLADATGSAMPCVDAVVVQDAVWEADVAVEGRYQRDTRRIALSAAAADLEETLLHELCHAYDHQQGGLSTGGALGVEVPLGPPHAAYATREARQRESFARACAHPELDPGLLLALGEPEGAFVSAVHDRVWGEGGHPTWRFERRPAPPLAPWDLEDALDGAYVVAAAPCGPRLCLLVGGAADRAGHGDRLGHALWALDPHEQVVVDTLAIPRDEDRAWSLLGGPTGALLVEGVGRGRAWWVVPPTEGAAMEVHSVRLPDLSAGQALDGTVTPDTAWVQRGGALWALPIDPLRPQDPAAMVASARTETVYGAVELLPPAPGAEPRTLRLARGPDEIALSLPPIRWPLYAWAEGRWLTFVDGVGRVELDLDAAVVSLPAAVPSAPLPPGELLIVGGTPWWLSQSPPVLEPLP